MADHLRRLMAWLTRSAGVELREIRRAPREDAEAARDEARVTIAKERTRSDAVGRHLRAYDRAVRSSGRRT